MKQKKMKKIIISISILFFLIICSLLTYYFYSLSPVSKEKNEILVTIENGSSLTKVAKVLKEEKLIRNEKTFIIYSKIYKISAKAGTYRFFSNYDVKKLTQMLKNGEVFEANYWITFIEGKTLKNYAKQLSSKLDMTEEEIINELSNVEYLKSLISKYWFITDDILNEKIYFPLEGYLMPDTYQFKYNASLKTIVEAMINNLGKKLEPYKTKIERENLNVHDILTLASIIEKEANSKEDRKLVSGVFTNRLNQNISLGSDVTTYYAEQVEMGSVIDLYKTQYNALNDYNTRNINFIGLPVSPICNSAMTAIEAAINPETTDYLFFFADIKGKIYYSKTVQEHNKIINQYGGK